MKKLDLGQAATILANVGVIAGIVFLGLELRQNNSLLEAEARGASLTHRLMINERFTDPQVAELMVKNSEGTELAPAESFQLGMLFGAMLELWEWTYAEMTYGQLEAPDLDQLRQIYRTMPGFAQYWQENKQSHAAEFRQWYDETIVEASD